MPRRATVTVPVTNLWTAPSATRPVDAPMLAGRPDVASWLRALDASAGPDDGRLGLHDRLLTQLAEGEPVELVDEAAGVAGVAQWQQGWVQVVCPWQPSSQDPRGYPGWVPAAHLSATSEHATPTGMPSASVPAAASPAGSAAPSSGSLLDVALGYLGLPYLWGGLCADALDCSGLVHLSARSLGVVVPRDADDQHDACRPVPRDEAVPGDLLFFARPGARPHHVGIVSGPGRMLHAPETGSVVVEEELTPERQGTLLCAGRVVFATAADAGTQPIS